MKVQLTALFIPVLIACNPAAEPPLLGVGTDVSAGPASGSFDIRNQEIRDEMIQMISDAGIEYWVGENGAIHYNFADGEAIDRIGNEVISEYITRN